MSENELSRVQASAVITAAAQLLDGAGNDHAQASGGALTDAELRKLFNLVDALNLLAAQVRHG